MNGRKRQILVDTLGLLLAVVVHPADIQDRDGARRVCDRAGPATATLQTIWADAGYTGALGAWIAETHGWTLEIVRRPADQHTFAVLPHRWIVERTFAWFGKCRRLSKDYEGRPETSELWLYLTMTRLMTIRLARSGTC